MICTRWYSRGGVFEPGHQWHANVDAWLNNPDLAQQRAARNRRHEHLRAAAERSYRAREEIIHVRRQVFQAPDAACQSEILLTLRPICVRCWVTPMPPHLEHADEL